MSTGTMPRIQYTIFSPRRRLYEPEAQNPGYPIIPLFSPLFQRG